MARESRPSDRGTTLASKPLVLHFELDTADLERFATVYGRDVKLLVDKNGRLVATVRGIKILGLGNLTARVGLGPVEVDESTGVLSLPVELLSLAGIKLGRKLITKKLLNLVRSPKWPEVQVDSVAGRITVKTARLLSRLVPVLGGYRVVRAAFASRRSGANLQLELRH